MTKIIRRPLTDQYGRDFTTGEIIESEPVAQSINQKERITNWLKKKQSEAQRSGLKEGMIEVDGFGIVNL